MSVPRDAATVGSLLRAHRLAAGFTQEALAERSGVSVRSIQQLEADSARSRRSTAGYLAEALGLRGSEREEFERAATPAPRRRFDRVPGRARGDAAHLGGHGNVVLAFPHSTEVGPEHGPVAPARPAPTNLPWPVSSLIGREADLAALRGVIVGEHQRLVTLTGVGGAGKTRLALHIAADLLDRFPDGIWLVDLAPTADPVLVPQIAAATLGVREVQDAPVLDTMLGYLQRKCLLLVLDNCEHLIDACADLAGRLLSTCPDVAILATSREPLRIAGERRWHVRPLAVPDAGKAASLDTLAGAPSVRLFVERAQAIESDFRLTEQNANSVVRICACLDGIPLAIELAASRTGVLSVEQIAGRLEDSFQVLTGGARTAPTRQQTMEAALGWSYDLLTADEQCTFRAVSVFAGGFDLEAAERVARGARRMARDDRDDSTLVTPCPLLDLLGRLVDKSLVVAEQPSRGRRYRLLEPVRQFALRALQASGELEATRERHAAYYAALAGQAAPMLHGPEQVTWLDRLEKDRDNFRAALGWIAEHGSLDDGLRLAVALSRYWGWRGHLAEGRRWLETLLAASDNGRAAPPLRMAALLAAGIQAKQRGDFDEARRLLAEAVATARDLGDRRVEAEALAWLSSIHWQQGAIEVALRLGEQSLDLGYEMADEAAIAFAQLNLGVALRYAGDTTRSVGVLEDGLRRHRRLGNQRTVAIMLTELGLSLLDAGDHDRAGLTLRDGLYALRGAGEQRYVIFGLVGLAEIFRVQGELRRAVRLLCAAEVQRESIGMRHAAFFGERVRTLSESLRQHFSASKFDALSAAGATMTLDQVFTEIVETP
jgi:non-specific serine/threonine protein kinase